MQSVPANPLDGLRPRSATGREAQKLYAACQDAVKSEQAAYETHNAVVIAARDAQEAYDREVQRGVTEGVNADREKKLATTLAAARIQADARTHAIRRRTAEQAVETAVARWQAWIIPRLPELIADLADEATAASDKLKAALASIAPIEQEYGQIASQVQRLVDLHLQNTQPSGQSVVFDGQVMDGRAALALEWRVADRPEPPLPAEYLYRPDKSAPVEDGDDGGV
jgi:hypothetical protein